MAENQIAEQKNNLIIRVPLSSDGYVSIYFSSNDGHMMSEREWWHLKQVIELASKAFVKPEEPSAPKPRQPAHNESRETALANCVVTRPLCS